MTRMPARRAAASSFLHGSTAALSSETSLPSAAPNPPGSRKSRCMSMMTSAILLVSTASGAGSAAMVFTGIRHLPWCGRVHATQFAPTEVQDRGHFRPTNDLRRLLAGENDVLQEWIDLVFPAVTAEYPVVPDAG